MAPDLMKEGRNLRICVVLVTLVGTVIALAAFQQQTAKPKFEEIDVERINIVKKTGK